MSNHLITSVKELDKLTQLERLYLNNNKIDSIEGLEKLTQLQTLQLSNNQISSIEGLNNLTQLQELWIGNNKIIKIPFTIMILRNLTTIWYDYNIQIDPIIQQFLNRNKLKQNKTIYQDAQNVHDSNIHKSISQSIYKILDQKIDYDIVLKDILDDLILTKITKDSLIEYSNQTGIHSTLNITFKDLLQSVWYIIKNHKDSKEIKKILNQEMEDSLCRCFTGRISRLVNCLNGFDERVSVKISDNNEISNIIILVRNKYPNTDDQKEQITKELKERGYVDNVINEWLSYL